VRRSWAEASDSCVEAIELVKLLFPSNIIGIDSDNQGEFINAHFTRYCERNQITFTRAGRGTRTTPAI